MSKCNCHSDGCLCEGPCPLHDVDFKDPSSETKINVTKVSDEYKKGWDAANLLRPWNPEHWPLVMCQQSNGIVLCKCCTANRELHRDQAEDVAHGLSLPFDLRLLASVWVEQEYEREGGPCGHGVETRLTQLLAKVRHGAIEQCVRSAEPINETVAFSPHCERTKNEYNMYLRYKI